MTSLWTPTAPWKEETCREVLGGHCQHWGLPDDEHALMHAQVRLITEVAAADQDAGLYREVTTGMIQSRGSTSSVKDGFGSSSPEDAAMVGYEDSGTYSRYFLIPKAGRVERHAGLEDVAEQPILWSSGTQSPGTFQSNGTKRASRNHHPTVKPVELMNHLVRLVTPPGGICLDPFLGSGTTALAAVASGRRCIGIERDESYLPLAPRRLRLLRRGEVAPSTLGGTDG